MGMLLEDEKAKELFDMVKENNRMLKDMRRDAFIGGILHVVWWVILVVVLPYLTWIFIQPYLEGALGAYQAAQGQSAEVTAAIDKLKGMGGGIDIQKLLEQFGVSGAK